MRRKIWEAAWKIAFVSKLSQNSQLLYERDSLWNKSRITGGHHVLCAHACRLYISSLVLLNHSGHNWVEFHEGVLLVFKEVIFLTFNN